MIVNSINIQHYHVYKALTHPASAFKLFDYQHYCFGLSHNFHKPHFQRQRGAVSIKDFLINWKLITCLKIYSRKSEKQFI